MSNKYSIIELERELETSTKEDFIADVWKTGKQIWIKPGP